MTSPRWLRLLPPALRTKIYYAIYRRRALHHPHLFQEALLAFSPGTKLELWPGDEAHGEIAFTGFYELPLSRRVAELARRGGTMVDVGANFGYFTLLWAQARPGNRVIAFEPVPRNLEALGRNIQRNQVASQIRVRSVAVSDTTGQARFNLGPKEQTGWGGLETNSSNLTEVETVTLDQECRSLERIDVLKIDAEGADTLVLRGAAELLGRQAIDHIFFEQNLTRMRALGVEPAAAAQFLSSFGYEVSAFGGGNEFYATPRRRIS